MVELGCGRVAGVGLSAVWEGCQSLFQRGSMQDKHFKS